MSALRNSPRWMFPVLFTLSPAIAIFAEPPAATTESSARRSKEESPSDEPSKGSSPHRRPETADRAGRNGGRLVSQLSKLRQEVNEKLDLSSAQKKTIDKQFEDYTQSLRQKGANQEAGHASTQAEIKALRDRISEARDKGDQKTVDELRAQVREKLQQRAAAQTDGTKQFLASIRAELNEKQVEKFNEMASRLRLEGGARSSVSDLGKLRRALNDPSVALTEAQKRKVDQLMREGFSAREPGKWNETNIDETVVKIRDNVMKELSPEQRTKVQELMAADKDAVDRPAHERLGRKDHAPSHPRSQPPADDDKDDDSDDGDE